MHSYSMHARMYVCTYVYTHVQMCICTHIHGQKRLRVARATHVQRVRNVRATPVPDLIHGLICERLSLERMYACSVYVCTTHVQRMCLTLSTA